MAFGPVHLGAVDESTAAAMWLPKPRARKLSPKSVTSLDSLAQRSSLGESSLENGSEMVYVDVEKLASELRENATETRSVSPSAPESDHQRSSSLSVDEVYRTKSAVHRYTYQWQIDHFSTQHLQHSGESTSRPRLKSAPFGPNHLRTFRLILYPMGVEESFSRCVSLFLFCDLAAIRRLLRVSYKLSILNANSDKVYTRENTDDHFLAPGWNLKPEKCAINSLGFESFILRDSLLEPDSEYLVGDCLTIYCELFFAQPKISLAPTTWLLYPEPPSTWENFGSLYGKERLADVTFLLGEEKIPAHKVILSMRSPVFRAMFEREHFKEAIENRVLIEDVKRSVFGCFLEYIYSGVVVQEAIEELATELIELADKYQVDRLKALCESYLCESIEQQNPLDIPRLLLLADRHNASRLKHCILVHLKSSAGKLVEAFAEAKPDVLVQLFQGLIFYGQQMLEKE